MNDVRLVGLDFGTTTSRCVAATARLARNPVTGRHELSEIREIFRSPVMLTPFGPNGLDERRLEEYLDAWLAAVGTDGQEIFGGGGAGHGARRPAAEFPDPNRADSRASQGRAGRLGRRSESRGVACLSGERGISVTLAARPLGHQSRYRRRHHQHRARQGGRGGANGLAVCRGHGTSKSFRGPTAS